MRKLVVDAQHVKAGRPQIGRLVQHPQLFDLPSELCQRQRVQCMQQAKPHHLATLHRQAGRGGENRIQCDVGSPSNLLDRRGHIAVVDTPRLIEAATACLGQPRPRASQPARCGQSLWEGQVLKPMQGVVVHEIANRCLARQHMLEMVNTRFDARTEIGGCRRAHVSHQTRAPDAQPKHRLVSASVQDKGP